MTWCRCGHTALNHPHGAHCIHPACGCQTHRPHPCPTCGHDTGRHNHDGCHARVHDTVDGEWDSYRCDCRVKA